MELDELVRHIDELCRKHRITVRSHSSGGRAFRKSRRINIRPVRTSITYAVALHEIGHVIGKRGNYRLESEQFAWEWARENALQWTETMEKKMKRCLESYERWARRHKTARHD